jgi:hypothetical protein
MSQQMAEQSIAIRESQGTAAQQSIALPDYLDTMTQQSIALQDYQGTMAQQSIALPDYQGTVERQSIALRESQGTVAQLPIALRESQGTACCVCMGDLVDAVPCPWCRGDFCKDCLFRWLGSRTEQSCPLCRHELDLQDYENPCAGYAEKLTQHVEDLHSPVDPAALQRSIIRINLDWLIARKARLVGRLTHLNMPCPMAVEVIASLESFLAEHDGLQYTDLPNNRFQSQRRAFVASNMPTFSLKFAAFLDEIEDAIDFQNNRNTTGTERIVTQNPNQRCLQ